LGFNEKSSSIKPDKDNPSATTTHTNDSAANVYTLLSIKQAVRFLHAAAGFPTMDSWLKAVELGHYRSLPGIDAHSIWKHFPHESVEIQKGHMKKQRQNVWSTKQKVT
jgi:hypothetical protein